MINTIPLLLRILLVGIGATLTFDLWGQFLKQAFQIAPSNICLVGRWLGYMPQGTFTHANIVATPAKRGECLVGWLSHYGIGVSLTAIFIALAGGGWLERPSLLPAVGYGIATVLAPFFIMQPAFGFGFAAARAANPGQARIRSLMNHIAFGVGLYLFGLLASLSFS